jgi:hypothetical protein
MPPHDPNATTAWLPPSKRRSFWPAVLLGAGCCLLVLCLGLPPLGWVIYRVTHPKPAASPKDADPWPECAAVREWFRQNAADPDSIQIVEWEKRFQNPYDKPPAWTIQVRYRGKNKFGALAISTHFFVFREGFLIRQYGE